MLEPRRKMKIILFTAIHLFVMINAKEGKRRKSLDQIMGEKYKFDLFENFEGCAEVYKNEEKVVAKLSEIKLKLFNVKENLSKFIIKAQKRDRGDKLPELRRFVHEELLNYIKYQNDLATMTEEFPTQSDQEGAVKAMFMLHYTYFLNLTSAVTDGVWSYHNHHGRLITYDVSTDTRDDSNLR